MALFPVAITRTQKPPLGVGIDWSNPLSQGLAGAWAFNEGGGRTVFNQNNKSFTTTADWDSSVLSHIAANSDSTDLGTILANVTVGCTILMGLSVPPNTTGFAISSRSSISTDGLDILIAPANVYGSLAARIGSTSISPTSDTGFIYGVPQVVGLRYDKAKLYTLLNGKIGNSVIYTPNVVSSQNLSLSKRGTTYLTQTVLWVLVWPSKALAASEIASLSANPWQIYEPEIVWMTAGEIASSSLIKSINGIPYASIKSINGLAIAQMKSRNGLS